MKNQHISYQKSKVSNSKLKQSLDFDSLGDKHKMMEQLNQQQLLPGIPVLARLDGRAFHTLTRNAIKPFDERIINAIQDTAQSLLDEFDADFAYCQSDEISLGWKSCDIFNGKIQKITSTMAAFASVIFDRSLKKYKYEYQQIPTFDCRVWQVPTLAIAAENIMWREMDATRNSISMAAHAKFKHQDLHKKSTAEKLEMLEEIGYFWGGLHDVYKKGSYYKKYEVLKTLTEDEMKNIPEKYRPTEPILRNQIMYCEFPKATSIANFADVLFDGADVIQHEQKCKQ